MSKFNYQNELKKIIDNKQLVEINLSLSGKLDNGIAYIIDANDEYLTFAVISNDSALRGVTICRMGDVESIQTETSFIKELKKSVTDDSLYKEAMKEVKDIEHFAFGSVAVAFENTQTLISVLTEDDDFTGRVVAHDEKILVLDEYYAEGDGRFSHTYINPANITAITVGGTWLKIITRSLVDKNL